MHRPNSNRAKLLADIVSIDAWHAAFSEERAVVDLHIDVVFRTTRVGGESSSPVRFTLSIKNAEVILVIPENEPIDVLASSVKRHGTPTKVVRETKTQSSANLQAGASIAVEGGAKFKGNIGGHAAKSLEENIVSSQEILEMMCLTSKTREGNYRWELRAVDGAALHGRGWQADESICKIKRREIYGSNIEPSIRVDVRCFRQDLIIDNLELKNEELWQRVNFGNASKKRLAAAEEYIKNRILEEGLQCVDVSEPYALMTIASVIACNETE